MSIKTIALEDRIRESAYALGFNIVRITGPEPFVSDEAAALKRIDDGHMEIAANILTFLEHFGAEELGSIACKTVLIGIGK